MNQIKLPVKVTNTSEYGGDVPTMSGGREVGFWNNRFDVVDAAGRSICRCKEQSDAKQIAKCLNGATK
jgi:hypothetical protein